MLKIPIFPEYGNTKALINILTGESVPVFKAMLNSIKELTGTPQNSVDWTEPDKWIDQRLSGQDRELALKLWRQSRKQLNPRWIRGEMFLISGYKLMSEEDNIFQLTERGKIFIKGDDNKIMREIDQEEGLIQLLLQAAALNRSKRADFINEWKQYLDSNSNVREESVVKDYLRRRMVNLRSRNYLSREGNAYSITKAGLSYLENFSKQNQDNTLSTLTMISREIEKLNKEQRASLRDHLERLTPYQFERLIKDLLTAMGYEDIILTSASRDKGVDITAVSQQGITTVKEVVQVKRFIKGNVQRPVLDVLRGSLHRFHAFQGTIITLSDFAKGAKLAAYETGAAPITLINGEKLIDMLISNNLIIKKKTLEYLSIDDTYFNKENDIEVE